MARNAVRAGSAGIRDVEQQHKGEAVRGGRIDKAAWAKWDDKEDGVGRRQI